jgi:TetR/AcrR family transcriptional regulator, regulator of cefoperazone and chloramphenicol sensitivity
MAKGMHRLGATLVGDDPRRRPEGQAIGEVLWAALRGLVLAQMVVREPLDSTRERATLADLLVTYLDRPA